MLTEEQRKHILNELLLGISNISNKEYQQRVWIRGEGLDGHDFTEAVCLFFDYQEMISEDYHSYPITETQYQLLMRFRDIFEEFVDDSQRPYLESEFIDTPEWQKIMDMAKEVLVAFKYK